MSYTIEYNRQFIKSRLGVTPVWLAGDNNVTTGTGRNERRCRSWCVFQNLIGVTEEEIVASVQSSLGGYNEHWRRRGKWVTDEGLLNWIRTGCAKAATIEEILAVNQRLKTIHCYLSVWPKDCGVFSNHELDTRVSTTEEFDAWIRDAQIQMDRRRKEKASVYPIVDFSIEDLQHPGKECISGPVLLRHGRQYLVERPNESGSRWSSDIRDAMVFSHEEAMSLKSERYGWVAEARLVDAKAKDRPYNVVLMFTGGRYDRQYIAKNTGRKLRLTSRSQFAKHYPDMKEAKKAIVRIGTGYAKYGGTIEAVEVPD